MKFRRDRNGTVRPRGRAQFDLRGRLKLIVGVLGACGVILVARAVDLQLVDNAYYQQKADSRFLREIGGAIRAEADEVAGNPRARSAVLRVAEKLEAAA